LGKKDFFSKTKNNSFFNMKNRFEKKIIIKNVITGFGVG